MTQKEQGPIVCAVAAAVISTCTAGLIIFLIILENVRPRKHSRTEVILNSSVAAMVVCYFIWSAFQACSLVITQVKLRHASLRNQTKIAPSTGQVEEVPYIV